MNRTFEKVSLTIPSDTRYLKVLRSVVESVARLYGFDENDVQSVQLASNEACANIIEHSYGSKRIGPIYLTLRVFRGRLQLDLEDEGKPVEPDDLQPRPLEDVRPGGLGLHLIQNLMDEVKFDTKRKNRNRLILIKERKKTNGGND